MHEKTTPWLDLIHVPAFAAACLMGVATHVAERRQAKARQAHRGAQDAADDFRRSGLARGGPTTRLYKLVANRVDRFVPETA